MTTIYKIIYLLSGVGSYAILYSMVLGLPEALRNHSWWKEGGLLVAFLIFTTVLHIFTRKYEKSKRISDEMAERRSRN